MPNDYFKKSNNFLHICVFILKSFTIFELVFTIMYVKLNYFRK